MIADQEVRVNPESIPAELRRLKQWVLWKREPGKGGQVAKVPYQICGRKASSVNPKHWKELLPTLSVLRAGRRFAGLGFVFAEDDGLIGIDLDDVRDPDTGELTPEGQRVVEALPGHWEVSPSGTGVKGIRRFSGRWNRKNSHPLLADSGLRGTPPKIEIFTQGRYFCVTTDLLAPLAGPLPDVTEALPQLADELGIPAQCNARCKAQGGHWTDNRPQPPDIVDRARRYLAKMPEAIQGQNGHASLLKACLVLAGGFALESEQVRDIIYRDYNPRCAPPFDDDHEIERKIEEAFRLTEGKRGALASSAAAVKRAEPPSAAGDRKPTELIQAGEGRDRLVEAVIGHLSRLGWDSDWIADENIQQRLKVYQRGGVLVEVLENQHEGVSIREIPAEQLPLRIEEACYLMTVGKDEDVVNAPKWLVDGIRTRGVYPKVRRLAGVVTAPTLRPDGSILQTPGYDPKTGLVYRPSCAFPSVPELPTQADARAAAAELLDVVADIEFVDGADRSAWLAQVLTMISREAIDGCCPMFATTANVRGSGKSLSVDAASLIALGEPAARRVYSTNDEELRKGITATALEGTPAVLLDNVDRPIGGASLDAALTAETWTDRILGSSATTGALPLRTVWAATGNNLQFGSDIARRVLPIRLASSHERPEERTGFRHDPLLPWVKGERPRLAVAALTILRAYCVAGRPPQPGASFGSFSAWSDLIRGAIVWAGLADPLLTREAAKDADISGRVVSQLIAGLQELDPTGEGLTARHIVKRLEDEFDAEAFPAMREVVGEIATRGGRIDARQLGYTLRKYKDRIADGFKLASRRNAANTTTWFAQSTQTAGDASGFGDARRCTSTPSPGCLGPQIAGENEFAGDAGDTFSLHAHAHAHAHARVHAHGDRPQPSPASPAPRDYAVKHGAKAAGDAPGDGDFASPESTASPALQNPSHPPGPPAPPCRVCDGETVQTPAEAGWVNIDCRRCGHVTPTQLVGELCR